MPKKHRIEFREVPEPITEPVTKFGGQPCWICDPQWPLSRKTGKPMQFICQIAINKKIFPNTTAEMAYLFMTDDAFVATEKPDGGENAVILQPGNTQIPTTSMKRGPTIEDDAYEYAVDIVEEEDIEFTPEEERWKSRESEMKAYGKLNESKIGGTPVFMQGDEFPFPGDCRLLLQLDSCSAPFDINFGEAGIGYAFLNDAGDQAKFLWQCA